MSIIFLLQKLYKYLTYILFPPYCVQCKKFLSTRSVFCEECYTQIHPIASYPLSVTKKWTISVMAVSAYQEPIKRLILAKGWSNRIASYQIGQLIWEETALHSHNFDYLIPIPLHWSRFSWRGYNQAEEIAKYLECKSGKKIISALKRVKYTTFQSSCNREKRAENVKDVFTIRLKNKKQFVDKHLMLVDDLMTTGATLKSATKELIKLKPASITAVVACRVV